MPPVSTLADLTLFPITNTHHSQRGFSIPLVQLPASLSPESSTEDERGVPMELPAPDHIMSEGPMVAPNDQLLDLLIAENTNSYSASTDSLIHTLSEISNSTDDATTYEATLLATVMSSIEEQPLPITRSGCSFRLPLCFRSMTQAPVSLIQLLGLSNTYQAIPSTLVLNHWRDPPGHPGEL